MHQNPEFMQLKTQQSVLITGSARSGTSIFGKLVGSLDAAEYFFEPPLLISLFSILDDLPKSHAKFLFESYTYEELLVGALSGRSINLREQDDSSIYHTKSTDEIAKRLEGPARKSDLDTSSTICVFKVPNFVYKVKSILHALDLQRSLISIREPYSTISSLMRKEWFSDRSLKMGNIIWPNNFSKDIPVPHWVQERYFDEWGCMNDADRAALYYITQTETPKMMGYSLVFDYEQMNAAPRKLAETVAARLGLEFGPNTETIAKKVKIQDTCSRFDLRKIRQEFRELALSVYDRSSKLCVRL